MAANMHHALIIIDVMRENFLKRLYKATELTYFKTEHFQREQFEN